ncbi:hypothetical protein BDZ89DRAFT_760969 [Hymenopellis radicata]|nr:hypothetical protein BDZ89DRAFT_760969 [Hymenopellis radicata]
MHMELLGAQPRSKVHSTSHSTLPMSGTRLGLHSVFPLPAQIARISHALNFAPTSRPKRKIPEAPISDGITALIRQPQVLIVESGSGVFKNFVAQTAKQSSKINDGVLPGAAGSPQHRSTPPANSADPSAVSEQAPNRTLYIAQLRQPMLLQSSTSAYTTRTALDTHSWITRHNPIMERDQLVSSTMGERGGRRHARDRNR